jgi:hypothetical protein
MELDDALTARVAELPPLLGDPFADELVEIMEAVPVAIAA